MRGEALNLKPIVPRGELHGALETLLRQFFARDVTIKKLDLFPFVLIDHNSVHA